MATNFGLGFTEASIPNKVRLCGKSDYNVTTAPDTSINVTFPGTPPFVVHSTLYGLDGPTPDCAWHQLPFKLTSNTFIWTPIALGRRPTPEVQGNETNYQVVISDGDSLVWVAKELQGDLTNPDAENKAHVSGNFTIISSELAVQQAANAHNGASTPIRPFGLKSFAVLGMLSMAFFQL